MSPSDHAKPSEVVGRRAELIPSTQGDETDDEDRGRSAPECGLPAGHR